MQAKKIKREPSSGLYMMPDSNGKDRVMVSDASTYAKVIETTLARLGCASSFVGVNVRI